MALKILLADDSMTAQKMGGKILTDAGHDVVTVSNGAAAMRRIAEYPPDLVVLDIFMPGYTGLEICERLKATPETAHIPVLLSVGKLEPFRNDDAIRVKADGVIIKPFEATDLLDVVSELETTMVEFAGAAPIECTEPAQETAVASLPPGEKDTIAEDTSPAEQTEETALPANLPVFTIEPLEHSGPEPDLHRDVVAAAQPAEAPAFTIKEEPAAAAEESGENKEPETAEAAPEASAAREEANDTSSGSGTDPVIASPDEESCLDEAPEPATEASVATSEDASAEQPPDEIPEWFELDSSPTDGVPSHQSEALHNFGIRSDQNETRHNFAIQDEQSEAPPAFVIPRDRCEAPSTFVIPIDRSEAEGVEEPAFENKGLEPASADDTAKDQDEVAAEDGIAAEPDAAPLSGSVVAAPFDAAVHVAVSRMELDENPDDEFTGPVISEHTQMLAERRIPPAAEPLHFWQDLKRGHAELDEHAVGRIVDMVFERIRSEIIDEILHELRQHEYR